jgi:hypothetical protein
MATGTGLDAQIGFGQETTWNTIATPTVFSEFNTETLDITRTDIDSAGLIPGVYFDRATNVREATRTVGGAVTVDCMTKGHSILWKNALGSTTTALTTGTQVHAVGGTYVGQSLTVQVGRPLPSGTVQAFTYSGMEITDWTFSLDDSGTPANLSMTFDGANGVTTTALASASYVAGRGLYAFKDVTTATLGGTALGSAVVVKGITIAGSVPKAAARFGLGNAGIKNEQLLNAQPTITGTLTAEFNKTLLYDNFLVETTQALVLTLTNGASSLSFNLPAIRITEATPQVSGPDVVQMGLSFRSLYDGTNAPLTVTVVN